MVLVSTRREISVGRKRYWDCGSEDMRNAFRLLRSDKKAADDAFYHWLNTYAEQQKALERERIIAILSDYIPDQHEEGESCDDCDLIRYFIRLIKAGE